MNMMIIAIMKDATNMVAGPTAMAIDIRANAIPRIIDLKIKAITMAGIKAVMIMVMIADMGTSVVHIMKNHGIEEADKEEWTISNMVVIEAEMSIVIMEATNVLARKIGGQVVRNGISAHSKDMMMI